MFTRMLAERLDATCALRVTEASDGDLLVPGTVRLAPGGRHLTASRDGTALRARLTDTPPVNSCRPSVDVLLSSLPALAGAAVLAVILTGMGADGADGAAAVAAAGGRVWVQDRATSVVWGMPGATVDACPVERVLPIGLLAEALVLAATARTRAPGVTVPALPGGVR
jgi:two-component system chemotaxis response regulator CheB